MKRKKLQKVVSVLLCSAMLLSVVACGKTEKENVKNDVSEEGKGDEPTVKENDEVVELNVLLSSIEGGSTENVPWYDNYLAENLGLVLRSRTNGDGVLQSMIASGEIPDLVAFEQPSVMQEAIDAGLLLDLTQYKEQLPAIFENDLYASMVKYQTDKTGTGAMYGTRIGVGPNDNLYKYPAIRWDVYASIGYPEINSMDDLLDVAKQMQEACPTTPDGESNYAFIMFPDWDGASLFLAAYYYYMLLGYEEAYCGVCLIKSDGSEEPVSMIEDNGVYYDALKFLFKANQMGLVDPDSPTLSWSEASVKYNNGQALIAPWDWFEGYNTLNNNMEDGIGYTPFLANAFTLAIDFDSYVGTSNQWSYAISANAENLDAALKYLNWLYSYEGYTVSTMGPEGVLWEYDEAGNYVLTETGKEQVKNNTTYTYEFSEGGTLSELDATNSFNGQTMIGQKISDIEEYVSLNESKLYEDWYRVNGRFRMSDYSKVWDGETGAKLVKRSPAFSYTSALSEESNELMVGIQPVMNTASWQMVFAKDEAEFDALWKQMKEDLETLGIEQVIEEAKEIWNTSKEMVAKYSE